MKRALLLALGCAALASCRSNTVDLQPSAEYFVQGGGLRLVEAQGRPLGRPCLDALNMRRTLLPVLDFTGVKVTVDFIERHKLAKVVRTPGDLGDAEAALTPAEPYLAYWQGSGDRKQFCFGTFVLKAVAPVEDAQTITAGTGEPYIVPGTPARAARLTVRLDGVSDKAVLDDAEATFALMPRSALRPADFNRDLTVTAVLPLDPKNYVAAQGDPK